MHVCGCNMCVYVKRGACVAQVSSYQVYVAVLARCTCMAMCASMGVGVPISI